MPDKATSVILEPMTPEEMMVTWRLPRKLNGPRVNFSHVVSFATTSAHGHFTRRVEELSFSECSDDICNVSLRNMLPNHAYDVQVCGFTMLHIYSVRDRVCVLTVHVLNR